MRPNIKNIIRQVLFEEVGPSHEDFLNDKTIMVPSAEWMRKTYDAFNQMYWNGELPSNISLTLNGRLSYRLAQARYKLSDYEKNPDDNLYHSYLEKIVGIEFSKKYKGEAWAFNTTMLHEMIHIADYYYHPEHFEVVWNGKKWVSAFDTGGYSAHGPIFFKKEAQRLAEYGWDINRLATTEEMNAREISDEHRIAKQKKVQAKQRKIERIEARIDRIIETKEVFGEKIEIIKKLIEKHSEGFTKEFTKFVANIGNLRLKVYCDNVWRIDGHVEDVDDDAPSSIKYQASLRIGQRGLEIIQKGDANVFDTNSIFENDYYEQWDLEDELKKLRGW